MTPRRAPAPSREQIEQLIDDLRTRPPLPRSVLADAAREIDTQFSVFTAEEIVEMLKDDGLDACRYGLDELDKAIGDLLRLRAFCAGEIEEMARANVTADFRSR